jgi:hypothetical protein
MTVCMRQPTPLHKSSEKLIKLLERQGNPLPRIYTPARSISASGLFPRGAPSLLSRASFQKTSIPIPDLSLTLFSCFRARHRISLKPEKGTVGDIDLLSSRSMRVCPAIRHCGTVRSKILNNILWSVFTSENYKLKSNNFMIFTFKNSEI